MIRALPDLLSTSFVSRVTADLRGRLDQTAMEAVTGRRSDVTDAVAGRSGQVHRAQKAIDQSQAIETRLALVGGRYTQAATSYKAIRESTADFTGTALQAASANDRAGQAAAAQSAEGLLAGTFSALNARFDSRSIFAGEVSSVSPLGDDAALLADIDAIVSGPGTVADKRLAIDAYFGPGGGFETTIYQGGGADAGDVVLPDGSRLPAISRADAQPFRDLLKGLAMVATSTKLPPIELVDWVRQGTDLIRSARDDLAVDEAAVATVLNRIDGAAERQADTELTAKETLDGMIGVDAYEAASEAQNLETRLQAAYTLTSRLNRLSLTNYLR